MSNSSNEIADEFFGKQDLTSVDFEITLAALLGTALVTYPVEGHTQTGQVIAFSLLLLTLVRRMAITSPFAPEETILSWTVSLISIVSTSAIIYLVIAFLPSVGNLAQTLTPATTFSLLTIVGLVGALTIQEFVFRDYFAWWHVKFEQKSERSDSFEGVWKVTSIIAYWASQARRNQESYRELGNRVPNSRPSLDEFEFNPKNIGRYVVRISVLLGVMYLIPLVYAMYLFGLQGILILPAVVWIHDQAAFWYIAYGNPSYEDLLSRLIWIILRTLVYVTFVAFLLSKIEVPLPY